MVSSLSLGVYGTKKFAPKDRFDDTPVVKYANLRTRLPTV